MTRTAQRIALAELDGYEKQVRCEVWWHREHGKSYLFDELPAYDSLDDLARVEKLLTREQCKAYNEVLMDMKPPHTEVSCEAEKWSWHSPADSRRECLLRVLNLWTE